MRTNVSWSEERRVFIVLTYDLFTYFKVVHATYRLVKHFLDVIAPCIVRVMWWLMGVGGLLVTVGPHFYSVWKRTTFK